MGIANFFYTAALIIFMNHANAESKKIDRAKDLAFYNIPDEMINKSINGDGFFETKYKQSSIEGWLDDELIIRTRKHKYTNLFLLSEPQKLLKDLIVKNETVSSSAISPDYKYIAYLTNPKGAGKQQIFIYSVESKKSVRITKENTSNVVFVWSKDSSRVLFSSNHRDKRVFDLWEAKIDSSFNVKQKVLLQAKDGQYLLPADLSYDNRYLLYSEFQSFDTTHVVLYDLKEGKNIFSTYRFGDSYNRAFALANDSTKAYFISSSNSEFRELFEYDRECDRVSSRSAGIKWDVEDISITNNDDLFFKVNQNGSDAIYQLPHEAFEPKRLEGIPLGLISSFYPNSTGTKIGYSFASVKSPKDVYVHDLKKDKSVQWTKDLDADLDTFEFVEPKLISYPTFDMVDGYQRQIPAIYYKPKNKNKDQELPVIISIHGGPEAQSKVGHDTLSQNFSHYANAAVILPNIRGSTGYGKTYMSLDNGLKREDAVKDILYLIKWIEKQPELDSSRIALYGGSYSGYIVLSVAQMVPHKINSVVSLWGINDFTSFLESTSEYRKDFRRKEYGDERKEVFRRFFSKISPLKNVDKITANVFIAHGKTDPYVNFSESLQIFELLNKKGNNVWFLAAENEGHGFRKGINSRTLNRLMPLFYKYSFFKSREIAK